MIEHLYDHSITCSYDEFSRYRTSAAFPQNKNRILDVLSRNGALVQVVADNFDLLISSQNGLKQTHDLAMILTQYSSSKKQEHLNFTRLPKLALKDIELDDTPITFYKGLKTPKMPLHEVANNVLPLKVLVHQKVALRRSQEQGFSFFDDMATISDVPEYAEYNTRKCRENGQGKEPSTTVLYTMLLNRKPANPTTMLSAMLEAQKFTSETGQSITIFTVDQQLYKVMIDIVWVYPELFINFVSRLGSMHWLPSYVGCIGTPMPNSGVEEILKCRFAGVANMLSGKTFPYNIRALRLLVEEILRGHITNLESYQEMMDALHDVSSRSRTAKHWVEKLIKPVFLIITFVRAEREGDWQLDLYACSQMLPYFFAA